MLNNPGFEDDLGFDFSNVFNWNGFFGGPAGTFLEAFNDTGTAPRSGSRALELTIQGDANFPTTGFDAFTGHVQQIPGIAEGEEYNLSIWSRSLGVGTGGAGGLKPGLQFEASWSSKWSLFHLNTAQPSAGQLPEDP